jgi:hypothetical protein
MAAQRSGAAAGDGIQGATLSARQTMSASVVGPVSMDDLGELQTAGAVNDDTRRGGRRRRHDSGTGRGRQIEGRAGGEDTAQGEMEVAGGGGQVAVAKQVLDRLQVAAGFEQVRGESMPERVDAALFLDAGAELGEHGCRASGRW